MTPWKRIKPALARRLERRMRRHCPPKKLTRKLRKSIARELARELGIVPIPSASLVSLDRLGKMITYAYEYEKYSGW